MEETNKIQLKPFSKWGKKTRRRNSRIVFRKSEFTPQYKLKAPAHGTMCLYKHWNSAHVLLFVGVTDNATQRTRFHLRNAAWKGEIAYTTYQTDFDDNQALNKAYKESLATERPRYAKISSKDLRPN